MVRFHTPSVQSVSHSYPSSDFCLWSSPKENDTIGVSEAYEVAWCAKHGHGTRIMPAGTLLGVSHITTPDYVMIVGFLDQTKVNLAASDYGGELDPHGADEVRCPCSFSRANQI